MKKAESKEGEIRMTCKCGKYHMTPREPALHQGTSWHTWQCCMIGWRDR